MAKVKGPSREIAIVGGRVVTPLGVIDGGRVVLRDGLIAAVGAESGTPVPSGSEVIDATGLTVVPGLIDLHLHGTVGQDFFDGDLDAISEALARQGVTTYLATLTPAPHRELVRAIERLAHHTEQRDSKGQTPNHPRRRGDAGARMAGIYLEGPYISPQRAGVLDSRFFRLPSISEAAELLRTGRGQIRIVTIAPELDGAQEVIAWLSSQGVIPSVGHSNATLEQVATAVASGLRHATHTFNAMGQFHHRQPGVVGAVLTRDEITAEVIADGHHVHPAAIDLLLRAKGPERTALVSDAAPLAGLSPGEYSWLGRQVTIEEGTARLDDGTLAGSVAPLNTALRNLIQATGLPLETALKTATSTPARILGLNSGAIEVGKEADIVALDDSFGCHLAIVGGAVVHREV